MSNALTHHNDEIKKASSDRLQVFFPDQNENIVFCQLSQSIPIWHQEEQNILIGKNYNNCVFMDKTQY